MTQERLAENVGISCRYLQSVEGGDKLPSIEVLVRIRATLQCRWDDLMDRM